MRTLRLPDKDVQAMAARLRVLRLSYDKNTVEWSEFTGIGKNAWINCEAGDRMIAVPEALKLAEATGVTFDWIYRGIEHALPMHVAERLSRFRALGQNIPRRA